MTTFHGMYPQMVEDAIRRHSHEITDADGKPYLVVAWTFRGGAQTVRTSARHLLDPAADRYMTTLCGHRFRASKLVTPDSYWTDKDCQRCRRRAGVPA